MILLETHHRAIEASLHDFVSKGRVDAYFNDFNDVHYHIYSSSDQITIEANLPFLQSMSKHSTDSMINDLHRLYSDEIEASVTKSVLLVSIKADHVSKLQKTLPNIKLACLKIIIESTFRSPVDNQINLSMGRRGQMYIVRLADRVLVVMGLNFEDSDDAVLYKVFLQELHLGRRHVQESPHLYVSYGTPPPELKNPDNHRVFITFVLLPCHFENEKHIVDTLSTCQNYLHYHVKCAKAYIHSQIRSRSDLWVQSLHLNANQIKK